MYALFTFVVYRSHVNPKPQALKRKRVSGTPVGKTIQAFVANDARLGYISVTRCKQCLKNEIRRPRQLGVLEFSCVSHIISHLIL